ncbi:MAG: hypothetical protein JWM19_6621 [Actinomycetia bacterium]|nr:hypothetical protein [Actinomycetes bacterium]
MRSTEMTPDELREAHHAAETLTCEKFRPYRYLSGRLLPVLVARFRDDLAEALGMELRPPPRRTPVRAAKVDDLTSGELEALSSAVLALVTRFAILMDDPALPGLLREFRDKLMIEKADRTRIADELREQATAS